MAKPGKFILNKLIRKIAALSSEGQRKSYCRELLCCSGRALCCSGTRLREADGRAPGLAVLGAPSPCGPAVPRGRWVGNFLGHGAATHWGARPLELLGSAERASWQELGLPFPSFLKLPSAMGLLFSMQGFHQPPRVRGHWGRAAQDPKSRRLLGSTCTTQSVALRQAGACVAPWPPLLTAELLDTERESLLCRDHHCACLGLASRTPRTSQDLQLLFTWGCRILFSFFWCQVQTTCTICSTLQGCSGRLSAVGQIP